MKTVDEVLSFWFGPPGSPPFANAEKWFIKNDAFDQEIREGFEETLDAIVRGEQGDWKDSPRGRLARVVVLDQFSRNIYRGTSRAFAQDPRAVETTLLAIEQGDEGVLSLVERQFLYMPLMHAESVDLQRKCVAAFTRLRDRALPSQKETFEEALYYAKAHADIVERFGRFPHRNDILGRTSTSEEIEFLKQPGSSF